AQGAARARRHRPRTAPATHPVVRPTRGGGRRRRHPHPADRTGVPRPIRGLTGDHPMRLSRHTVLPAIAATALAATVAGCSWFSKDSGYALAPEARPLEVPPDFDRPSTDGAMAIPGESGQSSVMRSSLGQPGHAQAAAQAASGFTVAGDRQEVYARVGEVLEGTEGVTIASRAQVLGAYDVSYEGSNFLVRVSDGQGGVYVSAVDPRGVPATGAAAL